MLHNTQSKISILKLASGEEIIGTVARSHDNVYTVNKPLMLVQTPQGLHFAPFLAMAKQDADVKIYGVVAEAPPYEEAEANYLSAISGIALPPKSGIIGV